MCVTPTQELLISLPAILSNKNISVMLDVAKLCLISENSEYITWTVLSAALTFHETAIIVQRTVLETAVFEAV